jgi:hypothetical protein
MNQKNIGIMLILAGIILSTLFLALKSSSDAHIAMYVMDTGSCFLDDGTCLHAENDALYFIIGWIVSTGIIITGAFMILSHEHARGIEKSNMMVLENIRKVREEESDKNSFESFLKGFDDNERRVLRIIREQQGIKQNTLRLKAETSKTALSMMLASFEKKGIIEKRPEGKTNRIFLKGYFGKEES